MSIKIEEIEYSFPRNLVTNEDLSLSNPDWDMYKVSEKTGVLQRFFADENETALDIAIEACEKIFRKIDKNEIDALIFCTQTPDHIIPPNSYLLHSHFNLSPSLIAFDINQACSGYIYSLLMANSLISSGAAKKVLLVNADTYSKYINLKDRSTRTVFGDGAAVSYITKSEKASKFPLFKVNSAGKEYKNFYIHGGGCRNPISKSSINLKNDGNGNFTNELNIRMNGLGVLSYFKSAVPKQLSSLLFENNMTIDDLDLLFFHQASKIALQSISLKLKANPEKIYSNISQVGNLVSASIPVAIKMAEEEKKLNRGNIILLSGFGVGLSWGSCILEY